MYSREMRIKAIELYLKYNRRPSAVIRELGYPSRHLLARWFEEYQEEVRTGMIRRRYQRAPRYTQKQQQVALSYYLEHGRNLTGTVKALGYPSRETLRMWRDEAYPTERKPGRIVVQYSPEQKKDAVFALCTRRKDAEAVAKTIGVTRAALYKWKYELLGKEHVMTKARKQDDCLSNDKEQLLNEIEALREQIRRLKLEKDILEAAAELIKKDPGVDLKDLSNREKTVLIGALKSNHPLKDLQYQLSLPKSSYYYQCWVLQLEDKYEALKAHIVELFSRNNHCYGYRRIHGLLVQEGVKVSEKIVRMLMDEAGLVVLPKRKRKFSSYQGEITPAPENLLERDFHADAPNEKWLTDITEFHIPAGKIYLSPVVDCFDGLLVSWTMSTRPDAELVNTMLDLATDTLCDGKNPIIHSDRGCHYRWPGWLDRIERNGLVHSMSKKGCSPDNAACEGLFGRIKNEMFYNRSWAGVSLNSFMEMLDMYLRWYNNERIKMSLGGLSPVQYRLNLGLAL